MSYWTREDPGACDLGMVGRAAAQLHSRANLVRVTAGSGRAALETLGVAWHGESSTAARARFDHMLTGLDVVGDVCEERANALRVYADNVQALQDEAAVFIVRRDEGIAEASRLSQRVTQQRSVVVSRGGTVPGWGMTVSAVPGPHAYGSLGEARFALSRLVDELNDVNRDVRAARESLADLRFDRMKFDREVEAALDWQAPAESAPGAGLYAKYFAAVVAGVAPPATVGEAAVLGEKVAHGRASEKEVAQYGAWLALFGGDRGVMIKVVSLLKERGVRPGAFVDLVTGDDEASQSVRDGWTAVLAAHSQDSTFAAVFMDYLGPSGMKYLYERIGELEPPVLGEGEEAPVIVPGESSPNSAVQLNALGAAVAAVFATASREVPGGKVVKPSWAYGDAGGRTLVNTMGQSSAVVFYYASRGGSVVGDQALVGAGRVLVEMDREPSRWNHEGPWFLRDRQWPPDGLYWLGILAADSPTGSQALLYDSTIREHLFTDNGSPAHRGPMLTRLVNAAVIEPVLPGKPGDNDRARVSAKIADAILDYVGEDENAINKGSRQAVGNIVATYLADIYDGFDKSVEKFPDRYDDNGNLMWHRSETDPPYSISIDRDGYRNILAKVSDSPGARHVIVTRLGEYVGQSTGGNARIDLVSGRGENMARFSGYTMGILAGEGVVSVEVEGARRKDAYDAYAAGFKIAAGFEKTNVAYTVISVLDHIIAGSMDEILAGEVRDAEIDARDAVLRNDCMIDVTIVKSYMSNSNADPEALAWLKKNVWPQKGTPPDEVPKEIEEFLAEDWDAFSQGLESDIFQDDKGDSQLNKNSFKELKNLKDGINVGKLRGSDLAGKGRL